MPGFGVFLGVMSTVVHGRPAALGSKWGQLLLRDQVTILPVHRKLDSQLGLPQPASNAAADR
ncbi:MAG: hypothetical protein AVDCRST_MAG93-182 [uncultured Chloroflexia bacterium]|uniref:Uncharacterized protein n=1 Tax=uncultured Chloroflexia bacterium TaxID=1672391 RepID=A0A6J4H787_9CHLR|nr:MAG: hypothetical protein AVDCRST_MAG93-182 [uncultured Chloroflexia bacterium]